MIASTAFFASLVLAAHGLQINTPAQVRQCVPVSLAWTGGESPYFLQVLQGGSTTDTLVDLGQQSGTSYTWTTNLDPGTSVTLGLTDSSGDTVYSDAVDVSSGNGSDCDASGSSGSGGGASASDDSSEGSSTMAAGASSMTDSSSKAKSSADSDSDKASSAGGAAAASGSSDSSSDEDSGASAIAVSAAGLLGAGAVAFLI